MSTKNHGMSRDELEHSITAVYNLSQSESALNALHDEINEIYQRDPQHFQSNLSRFNKLMNYNAVGLGDCEITGLNGDALEFGPRSSAKNPQWESVQPFASAHGPAAAKSPLEQEAPGAPQQQAGHLEQHHPTPPPRDASQSPFQDQSAPLAPPDRPEPEIFQTPYGGPQPGELSMAAPYDFDRRAGALMPPPEKPPKFYGLDTGLFKIGVSDEGSLDVGVDIGIARVEAKVGLENRVTAGVGLGPLGADASVGAGINHNGLHGDVSASAGIGDAIGGGAAFGANLGSQSGAAGDVEAIVGPANARFRAGGSAGVDGLNAGVDGRVGIEDVAGVHTAAAASLSNDSNASATVDGALGPGHAGVSAGVLTDRNTALRPSTALALGWADDQAVLGVGAQLGPTADIGVGAGAHSTAGGADYNGGSIGLYAGESGFGINQSD